MCAFEPRTELRGGPALSTSVRLSTGAEPETAALRGFGLVVRVDLFLVCREYDAGAVIASRNKDSDGKSQ